MTAIQHQPLAGFRVLEFGGYIAGPYVGSILCALGAEVVKVERPVSGDDFRRGMNDGSAYFIQYNAGKRSLSVDLKDPAGVALVKALIPSFDVVVENLRPGWLESLGLGPRECKALRPDLIYTSITGFGNGGPLQTRPAYDTIGQAVGGLYSLLSDDGSAQLSGTPLADLITGLTATTGVLAALVGRASTGEGQQVDTSLMEAVSTITIDALCQHFEDSGRDPSRQSRHPQAQNFCLKTASGEDIAIHLSSSQKFWLAFLEALDREDLDEDRRFATYSARMANYPELVAIVETEFRRRPVQEWEERLTAANVPFASVMTMSSYLAHPQTEWLELVEPERNGVALVRPPWRFDGTRPERATVAPRVGQHSREIAAEVYDDARIDELLAAGTLFADR